MDKFVQLEKLSELKDKWILTEEEFANEKIRILQSESKQINNNTSQEVLYKQEQIETRNHQTPRQDYNTNSYNPDMQVAPQSTNEFLSFATFFSPSGRMNRSQYWGVLGIYLWLYFLGITVILMMFSEWSKWASEWQMQLLGLCIIIFWLSFTWSQLVISIKRFHDMDQSGWLVLIPFYNFIGPAFIEWTHGSNKYGPDPVAR